MRSATSCAPRSRGCPSDDPAVVDAVWRGEALGTLLWALQLAELPAYDQPVRRRAGRRGRARRRATLRDAEEIELERESARLWHWRARTTRAAGRRRASSCRSATRRFDQLIAATAMRGYEQGVLPAPMRGDFRAYGKVYRHLAPEQHAEAHSIARRAPPRAELALRRGRDVGRRPARHLISSSLLSSDMRDRLDRLRRPDRPRRRERPAGPDLLRQRAARARRARRARSRARPTARAPPTSTSATPTRTCAARSSSSRRTRLADGRRRPGSSSAPTRSTARAIACIAGEAEPELLADLDQGRVGKSAPDRP